MRKKSQHKALARDGQGRYLGKKVAPDSVAEPSVSFVPVVPEAPAYPETHLCSHISSTSSVVELSESCEGFKLSAHPEHPERFTSCQLTMDGSIHPEGFPAATHPELSERLHSVGSRASFEIGG